MLKSFLCFNDDEKFLDADVDAENKDAEKFLLRMLRLWMLESFLCFHDDAEKFLDADSAARESGKGSLEDMKMAACESGTVDSAACESGRGHSLYKGSHLCGTPIKSLVIQGQRQVLVVHESACESGFGAAELAFQLQAACESGKEDAETAACESGIVDAQDDTDAALELEALSVALCDASDDKS